MEGTAKADAGEGGASSNSSPGTKDWVDKEKVVTGLGHIAVTDSGG